MFHVVVVVAFLPRGGSDRKGIQVSCLLSMDTYVVSETGLSASLRNPFVVGTSCGIYETGSTANVLLL
jgi:hypothetical protein